MNFSTIAPFSGIIDLYGGNDFRALPLFASGVRLAIHKAGEWEMETPKRTYRERKAQWQKVGGLWGNYFLPFASSTPEEMFSAWMDCDPDPAILRAIDWESDGSGTATQAQIRDLARLHEDRFGYLPVLYGSNTLTEMKADAVLSACPFWYANPSTHGKAPTTFAPQHPPQGNIALWQWSQDSDDVSVQHDGIDFNAFDGTAEELAAAFPSMLAKPKAATLA
jgi:GH25 family lysozyme M1 (1,4-beta-N-acetylmuramidase)